MSRRIKSSDVPLEYFSEIVEAVYDCAVDTSRWPDTLAMIAELSVSRVVGFILIGEGQHENLSFHVGVEKKFECLYEEKYAALNPHFQPLQLLPVGKVATTPMLLDESEFRESTFYREFLRPQALGHAIGFNVIKTPQRMGALAATRLESKGRFGDTEVQLFNLLAPHVCRSVAISDALNLKTIKSEALEATLHALACGVFMTDREGRVVYMNRAAEREAKTSNALNIVNNRLTAVDYTAREALANALREAAVDETEPPSGGITIALPAGEDVGLVATVLPLNRGARQGLGGSFAATAAIFVQDPIVTPQLPGEAFAKLYGLTGSELRVLLAIAPGLTVKEAAEVLGIGETTAKTHLQHIYTKTGTSKQTELLHLFTSSTPPVQAT